MSNRFLRVPAAKVFGDVEAVPILSARRDDIAVAHRAAVAAGLVVVPLPEDTIAVEFTVENTGATDAARVTFLAGEASDLVQAFVLQHGFERRIPAGAQLVEPRTVVPGDAFAFHTTAAVRIVVHAHVGA